MLAELVRYAKAKEGLKFEAGFRKKVVRWLLVFKPDGTFVDVSPLGASAKEGKDIDMCPHLQFSGDTPMRQFLVDTAQYLALFGGESDDPKLKRKHDYAINLLRQSGRAVPELAAIAAAMEQPTVVAAVRERLSALKAKPADNVTFAVALPGGERRIFVEETNWQEWWRSYWPTLRAGKAPSTKGTEGSSLCLVTGNLCEPELTHPKVRGLGDVGGKVETALVSFNQTAFCSFGLDQSANASIGSDAANAYVGALNDLIETTGQRLGNVKVIHWYAGKDHVPVVLPPQQDVLRILEDIGSLPMAPRTDASAVAKKPKRRPTAEAEQQVDERAAQSAAREFLASVQSGKRADLAHYRFFALTLSGSSARVMVRNYVTGRFGDLCRSVEAWFDDLTVVMPFGRRADRPMTNPPKLVQLLYAGLPERPEGQKYERWILPVDHFREQLWDAALGGPRARLPAALVDRAIRCHVAAIAGRRILPTPNPSDRKADEDQRYPLTTLINRMALFKAFYNREQRATSQEKLMVTADLDPSYPNSAYHCGRMMAVLEMVQRLALGDVGATVAQTFYASAAARPITAFGQLWTKAQHHVAKIENYVLRRQYQRLMTEISLSIGQSLPRTFDLEDQCIFHLGYYHQRAYEPYMEPPNKHLVGAELRVRSKSEVIICLVLEKLGIKFEYEKALKLSGLSYPIHPDFTIGGTKDGRPIYIEYLGMMDNFAYQSGWRERLSNLEAAGILAAPGGGPAGHLVAIEEGKNGVVDLPIIEAQIREQILPLIA